MNVTDDSSLERRYKRARDKVRTKAKLFEISKKQYLTAMFDVEKKVIKASLAMNKYTATKTEYELQYLCTKAKVLKAKYVDQLLKWRNKFILFIELAKDMGYIDKESGYLDNDILSNMEEITRFSLHKTRKDGMKPTEPYVLDLDKLLEKEKIREPVFEDYIPAGNKNEMYESAICKINAADDNWGYDSDTSETYCETGDKAPKDIPVKHKLPSQWKSHIYAVIKDYQKKKFDELNLHIGETVKQILPADSSGMAFGVKKYGLIRKKKGFFPMSHVQEDTFAELARDIRNSRRTRAERHNPILRMLDAVTEPKTKIALLKEAVADDDGKVYTEKKKQKKLFTKKNWLKIYGIDISDDEPYKPANEGKKLHATPTRIQSAKKIPSKKCIFSKRFECVQRNFNTTEHGDLVLEDIEGTVEQREDDSWDDQVNDAAFDFQFLY
ncbi:uncharacterized protein LOC123539984 isoform X2 [Mercenaria mercenaria]|nr:uncharacterized protein LOC123539984 isoform X2 [Mercenaria mercenaria]